MKQFQKYSISLSISRKKQKIHQIESVIKKITNNDPQVSLQSLERINKVAILPVQILHTSQYTLTLGCNYFAKVKTKNAIQILTQRMMKQKRQLEKWQDLLKKMEEKQEEKKQTDYHENMEIVGENEEGQKMFNIVEFSEEGKVEEIKKEEPKVEEVKNVKKMSKFKRQRMKERQ